MCVWFLWWERSSGDFAVCLTAVDLAEHEGGRGGFRRGGAEAGPHTRVAEVVNGDGGRGGFRRGGAGGGAGAGPHAGLAEAVDGDRRYRQVAPLAVAHEHGGGAAAGHARGQGLKTTTRTCRLTRR